MSNTAITQILTLQNIGTWSKKDLAQLAAESVNEVAENGEDVLGLLALAAKLEFYAGEVKKAAKDRGIEDLAKYGKGGVAKGGVKLILAEVGTTYDYSRDLPWAIRQEDVEAAVNKRKEWENFLQGIPQGGMVIADPDCGVEYHAFPPVKLAKESIKATIL